MTKHKAKSLNPELMSALNAMHEAAEDMPDGAWWAMLEDTVREFNTRTHNGYDPNDTVHKWIRTSGIFKEVTK